MHACNGYVIRAAKGKHHPPCLSHVLFPSFVFSAISRFPFLAYDENAVTDGGTGKNLCK